MIANMRRWSGSRRWWYLLPVLLTIPLGLASRRLGAELSAIGLSFIATYAGDALWAVVVYGLAGAMFPRASVAMLAIGSLAFAFAIEFSQLYRAPWIDALRGNQFGALLLGRGFLWSDLACYAVGIGLAALLDHLRRRRAGDAATSSE